MPDPHAPTGISATIKFPESARYKSDNPWLVFHSTTAQGVAQQIIAAFGLEVEGEPVLADLVQQAQSIASSGQRASTVLGATTVKVEEAQASGEVASAWEQARGQKAEPEPEVSPVDQILARIEEQTDVAELRRLYATNEALFKANENLVAAWKNKGKSLQEASK